MKEEGIIKNRTEAIIKEVQGAISLAYILMVGIGMIFEYQKYKQFGINIFQYADVFDFLIAPFRDSKIFVFVFISLAVVYLIIQVDTIAKIKYPRFYSKANFGLDQKSWFNMYRNISILSLFLFYIFMSSRTLARMNQADIAEKKETIEIRFENDEKMVGKLIGKTKESIFLVSDEKVKIIPSLSQVKEIIVK